MEGAGHEVPDSMDPPEMRGAAGRLHGPPEHLNTEVKLRTNAVQ